MPRNWHLVAPELAAIAAHAGLCVLKNTPELASLAGQVKALAPTGVPPGQPLGGGDAESSADAATQSGDLMRVHTSGTTGEPKGPYTPRPARSPTSTWRWRCGA